MAKEGIYKDSNSFDLDSALNAMKDALNAIDSGIYLLTLVEDISESILTILIDQSNIVNIVQNSVCVDEVEILQKYFSQSMLCLDDIIKHFKIHEETLLRQINISVLSQDIRSYHSFRKDIGLDI